jgi:hypothetical protein
MTTLTSLIRPATPAVRATSFRPALRGLVVFCVSAVVTAAFILDVASGVKPRPGRQVARVSLTV